MDIILIGMIVTGLMLLYKMDDLELVAENTGKCTSCDAETIVKIWEKR
jgi:hypothetical protein